MTTMTIKSAKVIKNISDFKEIITKKNSINSCIINRILERIDDEQNINKTRKFIPKTHSTSELINIGLERAKQIIMEMVKGNDN